MNNYPISCEDTNANTGVGLLCENTEISPCGVVITQDPTGFATKTAALLLTGWVAKIKAAEPNRLKPFPVCDNITAEDTENTMKERPYKGGKFIAWGKRGYVMDFDLNRYSIKEFSKLNNKKWYAYEFDDRGNIKGISNDGVKFEPQRLLTMQVLPPKTPAVGESLVTQVKFVFADTETAQRKGVIITPTDWNPSDDFDGVHNVELALVGVFTATGGKVRVTFAGSGRPVTGLVAGDFAIPGKTISTAVAEDDGGTYAIVSTGLVTSTINLVACASLSPTTYAIESTGSVVITVAA